MEKYKAAIVVILIISLILIVKTWSVSAQQGIDGKTSPYPPPKDSSVTENGVTTGETEFSYPPPEASQDQTYRPQDLLVLSKLYLPGIMRSKYDTSDVKCT